MKDYLTKYFPDALKVVDISEFTEELKNEEFSPQLSLLTQIFNSKGAHKIHDLKEFLINLGTIKHVTKCFPTIPDFNKI